MNSISIIIPVLNEALHLEELICALRSSAVTDKVIEIITVDGGSTDGSMEIACANGAKVLRSARGRAIQMNAGAREAKGDLLYFLHADSLPPKAFDQWILKANKKEPCAGCFRLKFDSHHWFLNFFAWCTRINIPLCRGGDQSLFIPREWFEKLGGYNEDYRIYEDNHFIGKVYRHYSFCVLKPKITTSARRYDQQGIYRLQFHFSIIHLKKFMGSSPKSLYAYYENNILNKRQN